MHPILMQVTSLPFKLWPLTFNAVFNTGYLTDVGPVFSYLTKKVVLRDSIEREKMKGEYRKKEFIS